MADGYANRICLVTGAGKGIGRDIAVRMAEAGGTAVVLDSDAAAADATVLSIRQAGGRAEAVHLDLRRGDALAAAVDRIEAEVGPVDVLVNNAAIVLDRPFLDTTPAQLRDVMAVNLEGPFFLGQRVARAMADRRRGGRIVNLASHSGLLGSSNRAAYAASKGALIALTRVMAIELAPHRITINAVAPGPIESAHTRANHPPERRQAWNDVVPLGRYGEAAEVSAAVLFLASDAASYITGQTLAVDGGFTEAGLVLR